MSNNSKESRNLYLYGVVTSDSMKSITQSIININEEDDSKEKTTIDYKRKPIKLFINSPGGSVYDGFGLINVILNSKTPVHGIVTGYAMSMGFIILVACHKRLANQFSTLMHHQIGGVSTGTLKEVEITVEEWNRLEKLGDDLVKDATKISRSQLEDVREYNRDWFIDFDEALRLGVIDGEWGVDND